MTHPMASSKTLRERLKVLHIPVTGEPFDQWEFLADLGEQLNLLIQIEKNRGSDGM